MNNGELSLQIEALLFALGRPLSRKELVGILDADEGALNDAIATLVSDLKERGIVCVDDGKEVELRISGKAAALIEEIRKEEFNREIGRAGAETLAAILYRGPLTRSEIDFIRGVNSSQTVRTLLMRGFIRKVPNPRDERSFLYEATTELLGEIGAQHQDELPEYASVRQKLSELEAAYKEKEV
ncbi:MAG: SMC-Scp complex subunit ScpB [Candidatus Pacebacteria bacterium]|nr:SMC-Scp complex subunit ScpB [Candidatus Paceibacterota bacterium]